MRFWGFSNPEEIKGFSETICGEFSKGFSAGLGLLQPEDQRRREVLIVALFVPLFLTDSVSNSLISSASAFGSLEDELSLLFAKSSTAVSFPASFEASPTSFIFGCMSSLFLFTAHFEARGPYAKSHVAIFLSVRMEGCQSSSTCDCTAW